MATDGSGFTRRGFCQGAAAVGATTFVAHIALAQDTGLTRDTRIAGADPEDDISAPVIVSKNGRLQTILRVVRARNKIGGDDVELRSYNGALVGPTLKVKPGDTLEIKLVNDLPWTDNPGTAAVGHGHGKVNYNATNLHTHGLHVSPQRPSDDVLIKILPKDAPQSAAASPDTFIGSFDYKYEIPANHPPGTHWYHAHLHGATAIHVASGMGGALIVEGDIDDVPEIKAAKERVFLFQQIPYKKRDDGIGVIEDEMLDNLINRFNGEADADNRKRFTTINGTVPVVRMRKGRLERWRLIHGGIFETLPIDIVACDGAYGSNATSLKQFCSDPENMPASDGVAFYPIARDGVTLGTLDELRGKGLPLLGPGNRMDVLVKPMREGTYVLRKGKDENILLALNASVRFPSAGVVATPAESAAHLSRDEPYALAIIIVDPGPDDMALPTVETMQTLSTYPPIDPASVPDVSHNIKYRRRGDKGYIGRRTFEPGQFPRTLVEGRTERWFLWAQREPHPFHIHVNPFLLIEKNGVPLDRPIWLDTVYLGTSQTATMVTRYDDFVGRFVQHCHNLVHEDIGMMELVEVVPKPQGTLGTLDYFQFDSAPASDFSFTNSEGRDVDVTDFDGKAVILNLWSPDCAECGAELKDLAALKDRFAGAPFDVAAVIQGEDAQTAAMALTQHGITGLAAYGDTQAKLSTHFGIAAPPASIIIDQQGHVRAAIKTRVLWQQEEVVRLVQFFTGQTG